MVDSYSNDVESYTIVGEMNDHGALTVRAHETPATFHVVEYEDEHVRRRLAELPSGSRVRLDLTREEGRGNMWSARRVLPGTKTTVAGPESHTSS
jgi:hypothetical protein